MSTFVLITVAFEVLRAMRKRNAAYLLKKSWETCSPSCQTVQDYLLSQSGNVAKKANPSTNKPLFQFGVIADIQHADREPGQNYSKTCTRYYKHGLCVLNRAILEWNAHPRGLSFIAQLGDVIDGCNKRMNESHAALARVSRAFSRCTATDRIVHLVGNHELYNFTRTHRKDIPKSIRDSFSYHTFVPKEGWRVIALDPFEISIIGWPEHHEHHRTAWDVLSENNPNKFYCNDSYWMEGLEGMQRRYLPYNGGISQSQLGWFKNVVKDADEKDENIIILTHVPLLPAAANSDCVIWNFDEILEILYAYDIGRTAAVFAGHEHLGGYAVDAHGIHHVTLPSPMEQLPPLSCHGMVEVYDTHLQLNGEGKLDSRKMQLFKANDKDQVDEIRRKQRIEFIEELVRRTGKSKDECAVAVDKNEGALDAAASWLGVNVKL